MLPFPPLTCHPERQRRISGLEAYESIGSKYQSAGRGRRIGASVLSLKNTDLSSGLRPAPYVRATKGKRPYGQARRLTSPELGNPMQNCHREEGALRYGICICSSNAAWRRVKAPFPRKGVAPQATKARGVSSFSKKYGPILRAPPSSFLGKEPYVTGFTFVSPVLRDEEPEPPSLGRGWRRRRRRIGASVLSLKNTDLSSGLRPAPYVRATKGKRPYGQARRLTSPELGNPMQNCHREEGALRYGICICSSNAAWRRVKAPFHRKGVAPQATEDRGVD